MFVGKVSIMRWKTCAVNVAGMTGYLLGKLAL